MGDDIIEGMNFPYLTGEVRKLGIARISKRIVSSSNAVVYDTFTGPDGTLLAGRSPDIAPGGAVWAKSPNDGTFTPQIVSNTARKLLSNGFHQVLYINSGISNGVVECSVVDLGGINGIPGIAVRFLDINNFWGIRIFNVGDSFQIYERSGNVFTLRASTSVALSSGILYLIRATLNGNTITATLNGANTIAYSSSLFQTVTNHGLWTHETANSFDNFTVTSL